MSVIETSQRLLARDATNSPKVAALFLIASAGWLVLDWAGVTEIASLWSALPLLPLALIYFAERRGKLLWFEGMTLPSLCVLAAAVAIAWIFKIKSAVPSALVYAAGAGFITASGFLMIRIWTFVPDRRRNR
ncbi:hypothetical protein ASE50_13670 [Sphingomonas sp. Leaf5]|nr:hypothetical protein ASE50_13670 [Sphingomonas sp. Leaf5]